MDYRLAKNNGDAVAVPTLVLHRLDAADGDQLRVALAILRDGEVREEALLREFPQLKKDGALEKILIYWAGAGLLTGAPAAPAVPKPRPQPRPPRLSSREVAAAAANDPQVAVLISESQNLLGCVLNESEGNLLASLYLQDKLPVDLILTGIAHFVAKGNRRVRYIARVLLSWWEDGIRSCADAERYPRAAGTAGGVRDGGRGAARDPSRELHRRGAHPDRPLVRGLRLRAGDDPRRLRAGGQQAQRPLPQRDAEEMARQGLHPAQRPRRGGPRQRSGERQIHSRPRRICCCGIPIVCPNSESGVSADAQRRTDREGPVRAADRPPARHHAGRAAPRPRL